MLLETHTHDLPRSKGRRESRGGKTRGEGRLEGHTSIPWGYDVPRAVQARVAISPPLLMLHPSACSF